MIPKIYLAGPIDNCTDEERDGWRQALKDSYNDAFFVDPCRRIVNLSLPKIIVDWDKSDISKCDCLLANCWKAGWGTAMEIPYAFGLGKFVVCVVPDVRLASPWIIMHSHLVTDSPALAMEEIKKYFDNLYFIDDDKDSHMRNC